MQALIKTQFERCSESVRQHCLRTGSWIRKIIKELGREELLSIWQLEEMSPVDYHDIGKRKQKTLLAIVQWAHSFLEIFMKQKRLVSRNRFSAVSLQISAGFITIVMTVRITPKW